jgi:hypothetical protein
MVVFCYNSGSLFFIYDTEGQMKMNVCIVTALLCVFFTCGSPAVMAQGDHTVSTADERVSPGGAVMGGLTELGMLAFGIAWEGVRIVLPEGCPLKEREVDDLVGSCHRPDDY